MDNIETKRVFYRKAEIMKMFGISDTCLENWVKNGYIKKYRIHHSAKIPFFNLKEIEKTFESVKV